MFEQAFKNIDDTLWKDAGVSSELDYIEQTSWALFFEKGTSTKNVWYYQLNLQRNLGKTNPLNNKRPPRVRIVKRRGRHWHNNSNPFVFKINMTRYFRHS